MKLKIFTLSFFLLLIAFPVLAIENFDSYTNNTDIDTKPNWTYVYGDHLKVKSSNAQSAPNSLAHADGYGSLSTKYHHYEDYDSFQIAVKDLGADFGMWHIYFYDGVNSIGRVTLTNTDFRFYSSAGDWGCGSLTYNVYTTFYAEFTSTQLRCKVGNSNWSAWYNHSYGLPDGVEFNHNTDPSNTYFDDMQVGNEQIYFRITSPEADDPALDESWITVSGTCPINGADRIGFTNDCIGFDDIQYTIDCVDNAFSGQFYKSGLTDRIIARDIDSISGDCVDYDDLMDFIEVEGFEIIHGYPDDWYFNFNYYDDYNIKILSPSFETALTLPAGSTSADFVFDFDYPVAQLANLNFNIKQYNSNGDVLNASFHNKDLDTMTDTSNYPVTLTASSSQPLHYVVQLTESGEMMRQYPFGIYVSDLEFVTNPDDYGYFFPRLVDTLKKKIIFNYYFAFHDGFYNMFNGTYASVSGDALDITFKSVSSNKQYNLDVKIFSASDARVKNFASSLRPYIVALLWLGFALYLVFRITHLFSDNE